MTAEGAGREALRLRPAFVRFGVATAVVALLFGLESAIDGRVYILSGLAVAAWAFYGARLAIGVLGPGGLDLARGWSVALWAMLGMLLLPIFGLGLLLVVESWRGILQLKTGEPWGHSFSLLAVEITAVVLVVCLGLCENGGRGRPGRTSAGLRSCTVLVALVVLAVVAEAVFVVTGSLGTNSWEVYDTRPSRVPGARFVWRGRFGLASEFEVDIRNNRYGYHDIDHPAGRSQGGGRVLVLGDSFVEGLQVEVDETVSRRLELALAGLGRPLDVVALGASGTGPVQQTVILERTGWRLAPDLVVALVLVANDVRNSSPALERQVTEEHGFRLNKTGVYHVIRFYRLRWPGYLLWRAERLLTAWGRHGRPKLDSLVYLTEPADVDWSEAWRALLVSLEGMAEEADARGARLAIVTVADSTTIDAYAGNEADSLRLQRALGPPPVGSWDLLGPDRRVERFCEDRGIPVLALGPEFAGLSSEERGALYFRADGHWTPLGHQRAAQAIARFIVDQDLLPSVRGR